ncbi:hypothetical protein JKA74_08080 [Marivirga sp. S37H4]|uniref:Uncharacterized protein n=1 Tax=Marivirga aurantiaca TaxID=2802615 RepID=A0A934WY09_9BACT|nr:hypothetical protein [Marivirga aurantiaca]MBK6264992.1 hypothetical protein [Marivirga aurantiaca]
MILIHTKALHIKEKTHYLSVVSNGDRRNFTEVIQNANKIHEVIQKSSQTLILLDYRKTIFHLPHNEAFNLVKVFEIKLTEFKKVKMAVIINNRSEEIGNFWASICQRRGFNYAVFKEEPEAEKWLLN